MICITGAFGRLGQQVAKKYEYVVSHIGRQQGDLLDENHVIEFAAGLPELEGLILCTGKKIDNADLQTMLDINLIMPVLCIKHIAPKIKNGGFIITIGSVDGCFGSTHGGFYAVAKAALHQYTRGLAKELKDRNIAVNCVVAGTFWNDDAVTGIADAVHAVSQARYISGQLIRVDNCHHTFAC